MTPWFLLAALAREPPHAEPAFGRRTTAKVRGVDPDADPHQGDGAYGRFDGDLDLGLGVGPALAFSNGQLSVEARGVARWYYSAGLYVAYGETLAPRPDIERRLGVGLELTPLFLLRWRKAHERGPAVFDLALDSLALGLGASIATEHGHGFGNRSAFEGSLGFGMPLAGTAPGPWLEFRATTTLPKPVAGEAQVFLLLSWHFAVVTPIVAAHEPRVGSSQAAR
jgi:hypothetical protein